MPILCYGRHERLSLCTVSCTVSLTFVVDIAAGRGSEGAKGVSAYVSCGNDVGCRLSAFGLGGYGNVDIDSNNLGAGPIPKRAATLLVGWRIVPP